jgi:hypothetical protein
MSEDAHVRPVLNRCDLVKQPFKSSHVTCFRGNFSLLCTMQPT